MSRKERRKQEKLEKKRHRIEVHNQRLMMVHMHLPQPVLIDQMPLSGFPIHGLDLTLAVDRAEEERGVDCE